MRRTTKVIVGTVILILILLGITFVSLVNFSTTQLKLQQVTNQYQPKMLSAMQLTTHFYHSLSVLGNYLIEQDKGSMELYLKKVQDIDRTLTALLALTNANSEPEDEQQLNRIRELVDEIKGHNTQMLRLAGNTNRNLPAFALATNHLEPMNIELNQHLNDLLSLTEEEGQNDLLYKIAILRYNWTMVVSEVRHYLAFRKDDAIEEIYLYLVGVEQSLQSLQQYTKQMEEEQLDLIDEFSDQFEQYKLTLNDAISLHSSANWRKDRQLMHDAISPTMRTLTFELEDLVTRQQRRIKESNQALASQINDAESTIRYAIQVVLVITLIVVFLTVRNSRLIADAKTERARAKSMQFHANHDALTHLPNRKHFLDFTHNLLQQDNTETQHAVMFIDLDGFKGINDNIGHDAGDHILIETAKRLTSVVREYDLVARLGGDEFTILLKNIKSGKGAARVALSVCEKINEPCEFNGNTLQVSASIGVTLYSHSSPLNEEEAVVKTKELMKQADESMYKAKQAGKNQVVFYQP